MTFLKNLYRTPGFWVVVVTVVVYVNSLPNGLTFDDHVIVEANPNVEQIDLVSILSSPYWPDRQGAGLYRPLTTLSLALQYVFHGATPFGYHLVNVAFHAANVLLIYVLTKSLFGSLYVSAGAALIFGLHPVQTEAVNGAVGRAELLSAFWVLLAWLFYLRSGVGGGGRLNRTYALAIGAAILGMLSKENAVCLVGVLVVYDWIWHHAGRWPDGVQGWLKTGLPRYMPFVISIGAFLFVRSQAVGAVFLPVVPGEAENILPHLQGETRWFTTLAATGVYLRLLFFPLRLMPDYSYTEIPVVVSVLNSMAWVPLTVIILFVGLLIWWVVSRTFHIGVLGILIFAICFSPVSNFLVTIGTILGERLLYLPMVGFAIFGGAVFEWALKGRDRRYVYLILGIILTLYGVRTVDRNADWFNDVTLFLAAVEDGNRSAKVYYNLGVGYRKQKKYDEAIAAFERVVEHKPGHAESWKYLGIVYGEKGQHNKAADMYEVAINLDPEQVDLLKRLGGEREALEDWERAERMYERALGLAGDDTDLHFSLARMCHKRNRFDCAIRHCLFVLHADAEHRDGAVLLAQSYLSAEQVSEARTVVDAMRTRWPNDAEIQMLVQKLGL